MDKVAASAATSTGGTGQGDGIPYTDKETIIQQSFDNAARRRPIGVDKQVKSAVFQFTRVFLGVVLASATISALAAEPTWHVSLQLHSLHWGVDEDRDDITNNTPGIGLMRRTEDHWLAGAGVFRNSLGRTAGYGYGGKQWPVGRRVLAGGILGLTHRYNANNGGIVPLAAAVVTVPVTGRLSLEFVGIPEVGDYSYNTLNFSVSWRL